MELSIASHDERKNTVGDKMSSSKKFILESIAISTSPFKSLVQDKKGVKKVESGPRKATTHTERNGRKKVSLSHLRRRSYVRRLAPKEGDQVTRVQ